LVGLGIFVGAFPLYLILRMLVGGKQKVN